MCVKLYVVIILVRTLAREGHISVLQYVASVDSEEQFNEFKYYIYFIVFSKFILTGTRNCHCNGTWGLVHCIDIFTRVRELVRL